MDELTRLLRDERGVKERRREELLEQQKTLEDEIRSLYRELTAIETLLQVRNGEPTTDDASSDASNPLAESQSDELPDVTPPSHADAGDNSPTSIAVAFVLKAGPLGAHKEEIWGHLLRGRPNFKRKDLHTILNRQVRSTGKFVVIKGRYVHVDSLKTQTTSE